MPRTTLILLLLLSFSAHAKVPACGDRVQGFNVYEELGADKKIVEKESVFAVTDWSPDSSFEGLVVNGSEYGKAKVELELRKPKEAKAVNKKSFPLKAWDRRKEFLVVDGLDSESFVGKQKDGTLVVRLLNGNGKTICEDAHKVLGGH